MNKSLKKILRVALICGMITSLLTTVPPLTMLTTLADCLAASTQVPDTRAFDGIDVSAMTSGLACLLFKPLQESDFTVFKRDCARSITLSVNYLQAKFVVEFRDYSFDNDLHFNRPRFSYRQSPGEHASEG